MSGDARPAVVFDINVYVHAIVGPRSVWPMLTGVPPTTDNAEADCLSLAFDAEDFRPMVSPHILTNITRILSEFTPNATRVKTALDAILDIVETTGGMVVDPTRAAFDVSDHEDNLILDLAIATDAVLVVTNDTDLTALSPWHGRIPILRPREFVARIVQTRRGR